MAAFELKTRHSVENLEFTSETFTCGDCGNRAPMRAVCSGRIVELECSYPDTPELWATHKWFVLCCPNCDCVNVICVSDWIGAANTYYDRYGNERDDIQTTTHTIYPADPTLPRPNPDMPVSVAEGFTRPGAFFQLHLGALRRCCGCQSKSYAKNSARKARNLMTTSASWSRQDCRNTYNRRWTSCESSEMRRFTLERSMCAMRQKSRTRFSVS